MKIVLAAHEFGLFRGRGGIATYLYHLSKGLLGIYKKEIEVHVIAIACDLECDLLKYPNFTVHPIVSEGLEAQGNYVLELLKRIEPDIVEVAEAFAFCLESILYRNFQGKELRQTKFFVINHTATKECFEWSNKLPIELAPRHVKATYLREKAQMYLADCNIFPAHFLEKYVKKNYGIKTSHILRYTYCGKPDRKEKIVENIKDNIDLEAYKGKFVISYVSRLEGRKNQQLLVDSFIDFLKRTSIDALLILAGNTLVDSITGQDERIKIYNGIPDEYRTFVKFMDFVDDRTIEQLCAITDLTVMTSIFENFPFAMIETVYRGIPIMTSKYNGCVDFMGEYKEEMSFDPFNKQDLTEKIQLFFEASSDKRNSIAKTQYNNLKSFCKPKNSITEKVEFYSNYLVEKNFFSPFFVSLSQKELSNLIRVEDTNRKIDIIICQNRIKKYIGKIYEQYGNVIYNSDKDEIFVIGHNFNYDIDVKEALINQRIIFLKDMFIPAEWVGKKYNVYLGTELLKRPKYSYLPILDEAYEDLVDREETDNDGSFMPLLTAMLCDGDSLHMEVRYVEE